MISFGRLACTSRPHFSWDCQQTCCTCDIYVWTAMVSLKMFCSQFGPLSCKVVLTFCHARNRSRFWSLPTDTLKLIYNTYIEQFVCFFPTAPSRERCLVFFHILKHQIHLIVIFVLVLPAPSVSGTKSVCHSTKELLSKVNKSLSKSHLFLMVLPSH